MIERDLKPLLLRSASKFPIVTLTGPRQSGKSTLCRTLFPHLPYASLEAADVRTSAEGDPRRFLAQFRKGAILDEVQRVPDLLTYLQGIVDDDPTPGSWMLTGSQNFALLDSVSQSLAGRTDVLHLLPLARSEVVRFDPHPTSLDEALLYGGYPRIFDQRLDPSNWLRPYVANYIERDVRTVLNVGELTTFQRFIELGAGRTAQQLNLSTLAVDCGVTQPTAKSWLSVLEASYIAFRLSPLVANLRKRLVKTPKLHFYDTGLACWLLGIRTTEHLRSHPLRGAIFETWVVSEIAKHRLNKGEPRGLFYYRDRYGLEADLVVERGDRHTIIEAKSSRTRASDITDGARRVRDLLADRSKAIEAIVVDDGEAIEQRSDATIVPWHKLHELSWV